MGEANHSETQRSRPDFARKKNKIERTLAKEWDEGWYPMLKAEEEGAVETTGWPKKLARSGAQLTDSLLDRDLKDRSPFPQPASSSTWRQFTTHQRSKSGPLGRRPPFFRVVGQYRAGTCPFVLDLPSLPSRDAWVTYALSHELGIPPASGVSFTRATINGKTFVRITGGDDGSDNVGAATMGQQRGHGRVLRIEDGPPAWDDRFEGYVEHKYLVLRMQRVFDKPQSKRTERTTKAATLEGDEIFDLYIPTLALDSAGIVQWPRPSTYAGVSRRSLLLAVRTVMQTLLCSPLHDGQNRSKPWTVTELPEHCSIIWTGLCMLAFEGDSLPAEASVTACSVPRTRRRFHSFGPTSQQRFGVIGRRVIFGPLQEGEEAGVDDLDGDMSGGDDDEHEGKQRGVYEARLDAPVETIAPERGSLGRTTLQMGLMRLQVHQLIRGGALMQPLLVLHVPVILNHGKGDPLRRSAPRTLATRQKTGGRVMLSNEVRDRLYER